MDFSNEHFVRVYTRVTATQRLWGFWGRALMDVLVRTANTAGVIPLEEALLETRGLAAAVAGAVRCEDVAWVEEHLPKLIDHGAVVQRGCYLVLPKYIEAQDAYVNKSFSSKMSRRRVRERAEAIALGLIDVEGVDEEKVG